MWTRSKADTLIKLLFFATCGHEARQSKPIKLFFFATCGHEARQSILILLPNTLCAGACRRTYLFGYPQEYHNILHCNFHNTTIDMIFQSGGRFLRF